MKTKKSVIFIIVIGIFLLAFAIFNYATINNAVGFDWNIIAQNNEKPFRWSPIVGLVLLIGGIIVFVPGKKAHI